MALAAALDGEIVSVDSMQVYRRMDIGTAKPTPAMQAQVRHHMIDIAEPSEEFTVAEFQAEGRVALDGIAERGKVAVIVGGSGLHFRSLVDPMTFAPSDPVVRSQLEETAAGELVAELVAADPRAGDVVDLANPRRVVRAVEVLRLTGLTPSKRAASQEAVAVAGYEPVRPFTAVGLDPGKSLADRVAERFVAMLQAGLLDEVRALAPRLGRTAAQAVGYKELLPVVAGATSLDEGTAQAVRATLSLVKRQRTFFRRDPRIRWLPWEDGARARAATAVAAVREWL